MKSPLILRRKAQQFKEEKPNNLKKKSPINEKKGPNL
jgi:hypothetical protein